MVTDRATSFIRLHRFWQKQILFKSGGISEQPNAYIEAMEILDNV